VKILGDVVANAGIPGNTTAEIQPTVLPAFCP
jgi:hypothetical protein